MAASNDVAQSSLQTLLSQIGPQLQADQLAYQGYNQQFQALPDQIAQQNAYAQAMSGYQLQNLGIESQKLGLQGQGLGLSSQLAGQQFGISQQQFGLQNALENFQYGQQKQSLQGSLAASGSLNTVGSKNQQQALDTQHLTQQLQESLANKSAIAGYQEQYGGGAYGAGQQGIALQNLQLMAQANGLSAEQVIDQLNYGIAQNKQQGQVSATQILSQMGNLAAGDISQIGATLAPAGYSPGINPITQGAP